MTGLRVVLVMLCTRLYVVKGDYQCVCSQHTQRGVFPSIAYIQLDSTIHVTVCGGPIPDEDKVSTKHPPNTTQSMHITSPGSIKSPRTTSSILTSLPTTRSTVRSSFTKISTPSATVKTTTAPYKPSVFLGHTELCPYHVIRDHNLSGLRIAQYQHSCFEVFPYVVTWFQANSACISRGGYLATLTSLAENSYLHSFLQHHYNTAVWIGLNDIKYEEYFQWSSGEKVGFTNWENNRKDMVHHMQEDCVVMQKDGKWNDVLCGGNDFFVPVFARTRFPYVCEYGCLCFDEVVNLTITI